MNDEEQVLAPLFRASAATGHLVSLLELPAPSPDQIRMALSRGARLDWVSRMKVPLVLHAIKNHHCTGNWNDQCTEQTLMDKLSPLLAAGARIQRSPAGETPLSNVIIAQGDCAPAVISLLLEHGADPDEPTTGPGFGALDQAVASGAPESLARLLAAGANPDGLSGHSVLLALDHRETQAAPGLVLRLLKSLLAAGANPLAHPPGSLPPLFEAVDKGKYEAALVLLDAGADPDTRAASRPAGDQTPYECVLRRLAEGAVAQIPSADDPWLSRLAAAMETMRMDRDTASTSPRLGAHRL